MFGFITHEVLLQQEEELDHDVFQFLALHVVKPSLTSFMKGDCQDEPAEIQAS